MTTTTKGNINAIVSAASFGLIPLFSMPLLTMGMPTSSVLIYRYAIACLAMFAMLLIRHISLNVSIGELCSFSLLGLIYSGSAICLMEGYKFMPSGIATTLIFSYPVWTTLLNRIFFHEQISLSCILAIILALVGVFCLSGILEHGVGATSIIGVLLELFSGLCYAVYMVVFPTLKIRKMDSLKVTFYIFLLTMFFILLYALFTDGRLHAIHTLSGGISLLLLGIIPTALSNITLIASLKQISSIMVSVLGAFEPLTAMLIGIAVFGEKFSLSIAVGFTLIVGAVIIIVKIKARNA